MGRRKGRICIMRNVLVVGSSNTDITVQVGRLPAPGETVLGEKFYMAHGGKGANQAVSAKRAGADVVFIGRVGRDDFGKRALRNLEVEGIDLRDVVVDEQARSGVALIFVDYSGENTIAVAPGANRRLRPEDVKDERIAWADVVTLQMEIPAETIRYVEGRAKSLGKTVILNYAPAPEEPHLEVLEDVDYLVLNELELRTLGYDKPEQLQAKIGAMVVLTLGSDGVVYFCPDKRHLPAEKVEAVDTVGAGDAFVGAFSAFIAEGRDVDEAIALANIAGAIAVTREGAQPSLPYRHEIDGFLS